MINISSDDVKLFQENGFTKEKVGATIQHYRDMGLADDEIQQKINEKISSFSKSPSKPVRPKSDIPDYSDILNNSSLSREQKAQAIQQRGQDYRSKITSDKNKKLAKMWTGEALILGSSVIPVASGLKAAGVLAKAGRPLLSAAVKNVPGLVAGGALSGLGTGMLNNANTPREYLKDAAIGTALNLGIGKAAQFGAPVVKAALNSKVVTKGLPKIQQLTTSVPAEYSERALQKELAGDSIFKGKFNTRDLDENYYEAGKRAINGIKDLEIKANKEINKATRNLNELPAVDREQLTNKIVEDIDNYRYGGTRNAALDEKGADIQKFIDEIANDTANSDLAATKGKIQNLLGSKYGQETGAGVNALKGIGHTVRDELNRLSPEYSLANANRENLFRIKGDLNGMNTKTMASRLRNVEGESSVRSGYNQAAEELDNLVKPEYKFLDDVKDLRAREALEQWFPGQYGGSGTSQGFANLARAAILPSIGGGISHNPFGALVGAATVSPKIFGKGTIRNVGRLNNLIDDVINKYDPNITPYMNAITADKDLLYKLLMQETRADEQY